MSAVPKRAPGKRAYRRLPTDPAELSWLGGELGPAERKALRAIAEKADVITVSDRTFILAEVGPKVIDVLAAFEAEGEDRELEEDTCPSSDVDAQGHARCGYEAGAGDTEDGEPDADGEPDVDREPDFPLTGRERAMRERRRADLRAKQAPGTRWDGRTRIIDPDGTVISDATVVWRPVR